MSGPPGAEFGRLAEQLVAERYLSEGWQVLDRRWRCPVGELDLVCWRPDPVPTLAIVEVKARRATAQGAPIETLTWAQRRRIQRAAAAWLAAHPGGPSAWPSGQGSPGARGRTWGEIRFDLVGVHWPPGAPGPVLEAIWGLD